MTAQRRGRSITTTRAEVDEFRAGERACQVATSRTAGRPSWDFRRTSALRAVAHADETRDGS
jgi:hypothetical protein